MTITGLPNLGNTCWLNSCIQFLLGSKTFCDMLYILKGQTVEHIKTIHNSQDIHDIHKSIKLLSLMYFDDPFRQQDSNEAVLKTLTMIHDDNKSPIKDTKVDKNIKELYKHFDMEISIIKTHFYGIINNWEPFFSLFPIVNHTDTNLQTIISKSLINIISLPKVLFFTFHDNKQQKMNYIETFSIGPLTFHLKAIILHHGNEFGGHYTSISKRLDNFFYIFDDNNYTIIQSLEHIQFPKMIMFER